MAQEAKGIRYQSEHFATVQGLMHSVNEQSLMAEHRKQSGKKATGVDGVSNAQFASTDCPFRMNGAGSSVEAV